MKVGILTLPFNNNYGGLLQSYSLQTFLKNKGHDVILIQRLENKPNLGISTNLSQFIKIVKQFIKAIIGRKDISYHMRHFFDNHMTSTPPITSDAEFSVLDDYNLDAVIVGSDQVWRFEYTADFYKNYFLDFIKVNHIKKIAYAASFGVDEWSISQEKTDAIKKLISTFDRISVRESSGVNLCKGKLEVDATLVLDPAFLLNKEQYVKLYSGKKGENNKGKLLEYFLDKNPSKELIRDEITTTLNLQSFKVGVKETSLEFSLKLRTYPPVWQWLQGFDDAEYVVTDSYHGCVFAIIFNKPFIAIGNASRGLTRFESVLALLGLKDRLIVNKLPENILRHNIDYEKVNKIVNEYRLSAEAFLELN
ncbi:polysaccharide pyruvyl transferase family protein [Mucilaginibacter sp. HD30]